MLLAASATAQSPKTPCKFDFGAGKTAPGYTAVSPAATYAPATGYGFDFGTTATAIDWGGKDALRSDFAASNKPFYFSVDLPEGNYNVPFTLGDAKGRASTSVKAESRRLLLKKTETAPGKFSTHTFTANSKSRQILGGNSVALKPRELPKLDWDHKLTLECNGAATCLNALEITPAPQAVTVFLAGNSTVVDQKEEPWASWGQMLPRFMQPGVAVANHAKSGLSLGSFLGSRRLEKVLSIMKPGNYLFIEFGHNDQKEKAPQDGAYNFYTERLKLFVAEAKKKGSIPVILTSTSRRTFGADGKIENSLGDYPEAVRQVARTENVALIDLTAPTQTLYAAMGAEESKKAFVHYPANTYPGQTEPLADNTHFNPYGAYQIAKCVVEGIKANKLGLVKFLSNDTPPFSPTKPDALITWQWVESLRTDTVKPDGN